MYRICCEVPRKRRQRGQLTADSVSFRHETEISQDKVVARFRTKLCPPSLPPSLHPMPRIEWYPIQIRVKRLRPPTSVDVAEFRASYYFHPNMWLGSHNCRVAMWCDIRHPPLSVHWSTPKSLQSQDLNTILLELDGWESPPLEIDSSRSWLIGEFFQSFASLET